jgi:hypothetical protein
LISNRNIIKNPGIQEARRRNEEKEKLIGSRLSNKRKILRIASPGMHKNDSIDKDTSQLEIVS